MRSRRRDHARERRLRALAGATSRALEHQPNGLRACDLACGRERPYEGAPRTLDVDLILYGEDVIDAPGVRVPHPRFRERTFVLDPLSEIAPDWRDPVTGATVVALAQALRRP